MPRRVARPAFPDTPGAWLANYRYRQRGESGQPPSAEQVGALLGVSGPTLRRWETGRARPSGADLRRLAACGGAGRAPHRPAPRPPPPRRAGGGGGGGGGGGAPPPPPPEGVC